MSKVWPTSVPRHHAIAFARNVGKRLEELTREPTEQFWTPEPVIGWRTWSLAGNPKTILAGANGRIWRKPYMVGKHLGYGSGVTPPHRAPSWRCGCGINAMKDREGLGYLSIYGRVALTGVVHEYTNGYRAERGEMLDLTIRWRTISSRAECEYVATVLERHYGVPVTVSPTKSETLFVPF